MFSHTAAGLMPFTSEISTPTIRSGSDIHGDHV